jgi:hypothetical protein
LFVLHLSYFCGFGFGWFFLGGPFWYFYGEICDCLIRSLSSIFSTAFDAMFSAWFHNYPFSAWRSQFTSLSDSA